MPITILSKESDILGTDKYRDSDTTIPAMFRRTIEMGVTKVGTGKSHSVNIKSLAPIITTANDVSISNDQFLMVTKFTALQHVTSDVLRAKIFDDHLAFLLASKASILAGQLPVAPITIV